MRRAGAAVLVVLLGVAVLWLIRDDEVPQRPAPPPVVPAVIAATEPARPQAPAPPPVEPAPPAEEAALLTVRVRDANGAPAAGARVSCARVSCASGNVEVTETADPSGVATLALVTGAWSVRVVSLTASAAPQTLTLAPGQKHVLDVTLGALSRLAGVVVDEQGRARGNVRLGLYDPATQLVLDQPMSNPDGTFSLELGTPELEVRLFDPRFAMWKRRVQLPQTSLRVVAAQAHVLSVRVVDEHNAQVSNAFLEITAADFHTVLTSRAPIDKLRLPAGKVSLRAVRTSLGFLERAAAVLELSGSAAVTLQLKRGPGLTGVVVDPHGIPLANVSVVALAVAPALRSVSEAERAVQAASLGRIDAAGRTGPDGWFDLSPRVAEDPGLRFRIQVLGAALREPPAPILQELGGTPVHIQLQSN